jgi:small-conductance mechanosensitive channel
VQTLPLALRALATAPTGDATIDVTIDDAVGAFTLFTATTLRIAATIIGGIVVALLLRHLIYRMTLRVVRAAEPLARFGRSASRTANVSLGAPLGDRREQRAETLNSVLGSAVNVLVGAIVLIMVLQQLGWDIGPIVASVGVVGVAVGFGAQSLVKDVLSGIFMLLEDQYGVGDLIDLGTTAGTVEAVGLRVTRIRDTSGTLWYHRNGEILRVGNQSQGWTRAVVDVRVGPEADLDRTHDLLVTTASELSADATFAELTIGEPTVTFVEDLAAAGIQLRVTLTTRPGEQGSVASELRRRIRIRLDAAGVPLAA